MKFLAILFLIVVACQHKNRKDVSVSIESNQLRMVINGYLRLLSEHKLDDLIITLNCKHNNDSTIFHLINSAPDLSLARFNGFELYEDRKICFVGDPPPKHFLNINEINTTVPNDVIEENNKANNRKISELRIVEPIVWTLYFKSDKLASYNPNDEIEKFVPGIDNGNK